MVRFTIAAGIPQLDERTGRGYYLCAHAACWEKAQKGRRLEKQYHVHPERAAEFWHSVFARLPAVAPPQA